MSSLQPNANPIHLRVLASLQALPHHKPTVSRTLTILACFTFPNRLAPARLHLADLKVRTAYQPTTCEPPPPSDPKHADLSLQACSFLDLPKASTPISAPCPQITIYRALRSQCGARNECLASQPRKVGGSGKPIAVSVWRECAGGCVVGVAPRSRVKV
jgi:hypothetical protein